MPRPRRKGRRPRKPSGLRSWSFSTHNGIRRCPAKVRYAKIEGLPDPAGPAAERGNAVHDLFERYVRHEGLPFPRTFERWKPGLDHILETADDVVPEMEVALTRSWKPTTWTQATIRAKLDLTWIYDGEKVGCVDFKTGRVYDYHADQLEFYATLLFHRYEWARSVRVENWYLDQGDERTERSYVRTQYEREFLPRWAERVEADLCRTEWPAVRNKFCGYCPFNSRKGGPCVEGA